MSNGKLKRRKGRRTDYRGDYRPVQRLPRRIGKLKISPQIAEQHKR